MIPQRTACRASAGVIALVALVFAACGSSSGAPATTSTLSVTKILVGARLPGTSTAQWQAIQAGGKKAIGFAGAGTTGDYAEGQSAGQLIAFFQFPDSATAEAFYSNTRSATRFVVPKALLPTDITGSGPVASSSRWLDLRWCVGTPSSHQQGFPPGLPLREKANGKCPFGVLVSAEIASITRRGSVVLVVQTSGYDTDTSNGPVSKVSTAPAGEVATNVSLTNSLLTLLQTLGIH
jgi:hypothetical protein